MTPDDAVDDPEAGATATLRTTHEDPAVVAGALAPDNTPEIDTRVADGQVVTTVAREDAAGVRSTVDDYLVNLDVAERTAATARRYRDRPGRDDDGTDDSRRRPDEGTDNEPHRQTDDEHDTPNDT